MKKQFTATLFILKENKILLIYHKKHRCWLPPGGHVENELPSEAAVREAFEETGLEAELITQENIWVPSSHNSASFPRPYLCLIENIPPHGGVEAHQHIDFIYIGRPIGGELKCNHQECENLKWFSLNCLQQLEKGKEIFEDTYQICMHLFKENKSFKY